MSDGPDFIPAEELEAEEARHARDQEEYEHDAAVACLDFANDLALMIDRWGFERVNKGFNAMGYVLKSK